MIPTEHISDKLDRRANDCVWKVKIDDGRELFIFIMIEFQSTPQRLMPLRMSTYRNLLYQHLIKSGEIEKNHKLSPVLPIVIYNGDKEWRYPTSLFDIIDNSGDELLELIRNDSFLLFDINKISKETLESKNMEKSKNYVSKIFSLEQSAQYGHIINVVAQIHQWLDESKDEELSKALAVWFNNVLRPSKQSRVQLPLFENFSEVKSMFLKNLERIVDKAEEEALERGRMEGMEKGVEKGKLQGREEGTILTATHFKQLGVDIETISKATGLSPEQIEKL
ncbi:MAG: Rpn family recombination-promoting nuclease/putative transposase, partial [Deltaproteobacteria bacterium]|nr:Rpn family recombination-promoting nuclease/putative transposase [Deltaproteobacteria bacterium]